MHIFYKSFLNEKSLFREERPYTAWLFPLQTSRFKSPTTPSSSFSAFKIFSIHPRRHVRRRSCGKSSSCGGGCGPISRHGRGGMQGGRSTACEALRYEAPPWVKNVIITDDEFYRTLCDKSFAAHCYHIELLGPESDRNKNGTSCYAKHRCAWLTET